MERDIEERWKGCLWPPDLSRLTDVFAILDGARDECIYGAVDGCKLERACLYTGNLPWQLSMAAPYLVRLEKDAEFTHFVATQGWGRSWGIYLRSDVGFKAVRRHLRGFLRVRDERGKRLLFRYYDPGTLRLYLPTCWPSELETVFGPVQSYVAEGESAEELLEFRMEKRALVSTRVALRAAEARA